jgi:septal ring-binding cell division protein DamX
MALEQLPMLPSQTTLIERVKYQLTVGNPFVVVTGERGSGKTVLLEKISSLIDEKFLCAFIPCSSKLEVSALREILMQQLSPNIIFNSSDSLLDVLQRVDFKDKKVCIVVDNIDLANKDFFKELSYLRKIKNGELFYLILSSTSSWLSEQILNIDESLIEIEIPQLTEEDKIIELEYYLKLLNVKYSASSLSKDDRLVDLLTPEDVKNLAEHLSHNNEDLKMPTNKNNVSSKASDISLKKDIPFKKNKDKQESNSIKLYMIMGVISLFVIVGAIIWKVTQTEKYDVVTNVGIDNPPKHQIDVSDLSEEPEEYDNKTVELTDNPVVVDEKSKDIKAQIIVTDEALKTIENSNKDLTQKQVEKVEITDKINVPKEDVVVKEENKISDKYLVADSKIQSDKVEQLKNVADSTIAKEQNTQKQSSNLSSSDNVNTQNTDKLYVKEEVLNNKQTESQDNKAPAVTDDTTKAKEQAKNIVASDVKKQETKEVIKETVTDNKNINLMPDDHYSVQLTASTKSFCQKIAKKVKGDTWIEYRKKDDKYIVLWGDYKNLNEAKAAIRKLPNSIRKAGPWPKQFKKIKAELK